MGFHKAKGPVTVQHSFLNHLLLCDQFRLVIGVGQCHKESALVGIG